MKNPEFIKRKSFNDILINFGVPKISYKIKICLDGTQNKVRIGKYYSYRFPNENSLKHGDTLSPVIFSFTLEYAVQSNRKLNWDWILMVLCRWCKFNRTIEKMKVS